MREIRLPDIGDFEDVDVVEILVRPGDRIDAEESLIVLESDKATMEIPCPVAGVVKELRVAVGDQVSQGSLLALLETDEDSVAPEAPQPDALSTPASLANEFQPPRTARDRAPGPLPPVPDAVATPAQESRLPGSGAKAAAPHASPSVRRLARELGVDLALVPASGRKGRILKADVEGYVKGMIAKGTASGIPIAGVNVARAPEIDFSRFGPTELQPLNKIRRLAAANLHRSWVTVPHVTQFDEADVTDLETFRKAQKPSAEEQGTVLTFVPFIAKAVAAVLGEFPHFNSSLDATGENLIVKRYVHIGVAVDTPHGLVVPVLRDADRRGILDLATELQDLSARGRERKLRPEDLQGGSFTISSLGGIGGRFFTPIVNHPEVAVLGVSRMEWKPIYRGPELERRLILPLSLSYDHRVIDGADAVRFTTRLAQVLGDLRMLLL